MSTMVCILYETLIALPPYMYVNTSRELFHPIWTLLGGKTPMNLLSCTSSSTDNSELVTMAWFRDLDSRHFYYYQGIPKWSSRCWENPLLMVGCLSNIPIFPHFGLTILLLVTLPNMPCHQNPYDSPHLWTSFQYHPNTTPLVQSPWWSRLQIFLGARLHVCWLFFPAFWYHIDNSQVGYLPLKQL